MLARETINFTEMPHDEIDKTLQEYRLVLTRDEILKIQNDILKRPPTLTECVLWSIQGSEHSSYKSSRPHLKQFVTEGPNVMLGPSEDAGIAEIARDSNGHRYGIVVSHESHNHPSQIVPYEGAATGIGGNVRDVSCMGAKVIAIADALRFGSICDANPRMYANMANHTNQQIERERNIRRFEGFADWHAFVDSHHNRTRWITNGVVSGIAGYGNPIGVPNIAGDVYFDESYNDNCLVNVVTLGVLREDELIHSRAPANSAGYDLILVGKPTDNSGFGGASFASTGLRENEQDQNKGAVQEPNAFLKRHLLKATYGLFDLLKERHLLHLVGFKDLGAGGIACASVELADGAGLGAEVNLDLVHRSMDHLHPSVILCSETQERYMWVAHPEVTPIILEHYNKTFDLPKIAEGARASVIGKIRADGQYIVTYQGETLVDANACDITRGLVYDRPYRKPERTFSEPEIHEPNPRRIFDPNLRISTNPQIATNATNSANSYSQSVVSVDSESSVDSDHRIRSILLHLLAHENVASRSPIFEQYDKTVQGITVIERGDADAGVMRPFLDEKYPDEIRNVGFALSVAHNPRYCKIDPYWGAVNAVVESMRKVAAVGAVPWALTDCLNFGNPEVPEQMWEFVESVRGISDAQRGVHLKLSPAFPTPIISGNVSFYNVSQNGSIAPSPIISCLGRILDMRKAITMHFKRPDSVILMIGERRDECGGSVYYDLYNELGANIPKPDLHEVENQIFALTDAIDQGLIFATHNISAGGIAVTLAEMSFGNEIGFQVTIPGDLRPDKKLFSETGGFVLEVARENVGLVKDIFAGRSVHAMEIGETIADCRLLIADCLDIDMASAKNAWLNGLREKL